MSNPNPYNSPYGNTPQQDYGTQPQPNDAGQQGQGALITSPHPMAGCGGNFKKRSRQ